MHELSTHFISVVGSGYIVLPLIRKDVHIDHVVMQKKLQFPWKTDAFKGIVEVIHGKQMHLKA